MVHDPALCRDVHDPGGRAGSGSGTAATQLGDDDHAVRPSSSRGAEKRTRQDGVSVTDDTTNSKIDIDAAKIRASIQQYRETDDREEQREIENEVLRETVWKPSQEPSETALTLKPRQIELVYKRLPDDAKEAKRILRSHYVEEL